MLNLDENPALDILIDRYVKGETSPTETKDFEKKIHINPELQKEVEFRIQLLRTMQFQEGLSIQRTFKTIMNNQPPIEPDMNFRDYPSEWRPWLFGIIAILTIASLPLIFPTLNPFLDAQETSPQDEGQIISNDALNNKINELLFPYENKFTSELNPNEPIGRGMTAYLNEDYLQAIRFFNQAIARNNDDYEAHFYIGVSYLMSQSSEKAIPHFNILIENNDLMFNVPAQWYLALAYLQLEELELATPILEELLETSYDVEAGQLLDLLIQ